VLNVGVSGDMIGRTLIQFQAKVMFLAPVDRIWSSRAFVYSFFEIQNLWFSHLLTLNLTSV
jgi:hypothetical protein